MCVDTNLHISRSQVTLVLLGTERRYGYRWVPVPFSWEFPICIHPGEQFISFSLIYIAFCLGVSLIDIILKYCLSIQKPFDNWLTPRLLVTTNYFTFWTLCKSYNKKSLLTSWKGKFLILAFPLMKGSLARPGKMMPFKVIKCKLSQVFRSCIWVITQVGAAVKFQYQNQIHCILWRRVRTEFWLPPVDQWGTKKANSVLRTINLNWCQ